MSSGAKDVKSQPMVDLKATAFALFEESRIAAQKKKETQAREMKWTEDKFKELGVLGKMAASFQTHMAATKMANDTSLYFQRPKINPQLPFCDSEKWGMIQLNPMANQSSSHLWCLPNEIHLEASKKLVRTFEAQLESLGFEVMNDMINFVPSAPKK